MKERLRKIYTSKRKYSKNDLNKSFNKYAKTNKQTNKTKKKQQQKTKPYKEKKNPTSN